MVEQYRRRERRTASPPIRLETDSTVKQLIWLVEHTPPNWDRIIEEACTNKLAGFIGGHGFVVENHVTDTLDWAVAQTNFGSRVRRNPIKDGTKTKHFHFTRDQQGHIIVENRRTSLTYTEYDELTETAGLMTLWEAKATIITNGKKSPLAEDEIQRKFMPLEECFPGGPFGYVIAGLPSRNKKFPQRKRLFEKRGGHIAIVDMTFEELMRRASPKRLYARVNGYQTV